MARLNHPNIKGVHVDVPPRDVKRWKRSGWIAPATHAPNPSQAVKARASTPPPTPHENAANEKE